MPTADYSSYHQASGTVADGTKFDNLIDAIQATVNGIDNNNFAAGKIFDLTKLMQNSAVTGSLLRWDGTNWSKTTNVIVDDTNSKITLDGDTNLYRSAAGVLKTDGMLQASGGLTPIVLSVAATDVNVPLNAVGTIAVDATNNRIYVRCIGGWKSVALA